MKRKTLFSKGQKVDDYLLERPLGAGQDGEVWQVTKLSLGKRFAAKFLNVESEEKRRRFEREIQILSYIGHPNVALIVDKGEAWNPTTTKVVPYYVMEFLDAQPIDVALEGISHDGLLKTVCSLFQQVASALITIHRVAITHGDLKPANILVIRHDKVAKLTDFGFGLMPGTSREERDEYPSSSYRSPKGLSPEQADVHKCGCTFRQCLRAVGSRLSTSQRAALDELIRNLVENPDNASLEAFVTALELVEESERSLSRQEREHETEVESKVPEINDATKILFRLAIQGDIGFTSRCTVIIDLPEFQRLRRLREAAVQESVYLSLSQSRFEAVLSGYGMVVSYLKRLTRVSQFSDVIAPLHLRTALLLSLLMQIGEYPFSRNLWRATGREALDPLVRGASIVLKEPLATIVSRDWDLDPGLVAMLLTRTVPKGDFKAWHLLLSLLSGPLGALELDSMIRLSWRVGAQTSLNLSTLISSLRVSLEGDCLAVDANSLKTLEEYAISQYILLKNVTLHRASVSANAMLTQSFQELDDAGVDFEVLIQANDWQFLDECISEAHTRDLRRAETLLRSYSQRRLHKHVLKWARGSGEALVASNDLALSRNLEAQLSNRLGEELPSGCIVFDSGPKVRFGLNVPIILDGKQALSDQESPIIANTLETAESEFFNTRTLLASAEVSARLEEVGDAELTKIVEAVIEDYGRG